MLLVPASRKAPCRRGFSLMEVLVVCALMSAISLFTIVLYKTAIGDFEHASTKLSMSNYARRASQKIAQILATASSRRPGTPVPEAFYCPDDSSSGTEYTFVDFLSTSNYIRTAATEVSYAFDTGIGTVPGYTSLFRYRMAWTDAPIGNIARNSVYLERLQLNPNDATIQPGGLPGGLPAIGSAAPVGGYRQSIAINLNRCTFRRTFSGTMQLRILVYAFDPVTGRGLDGNTMRKMSKRRRTDVTGANDEKSYELLTAVPLPTINIK